MSATRSTSTIAALYADEQVRLTRHLVRRGMSAAAAADAVQDSFIRLLHTPRPDIRDLRSYLRRTAETVAIDHWRSQARADAVIEKSGLPDAEIADSALSSEAALISRQELAALDAAILGLPPRCREVLILHKFEGLSYVEIAERLGIARNTVMVHLANAMNALRRGMRAADSPFE